MSNNWRSRLEAIFPPISPAIQDEVVPPAPSDLEPVLVIDSDQNRANECTGSLRTLGFDPLVACNLQTARAMLQARGISIAIIECHMPGDDGIALSYELTQLAEAQGRKLHVIMVSGFATKDVVIRAMQASAVDFLERPIRQIDLRRSLRRIKGLSETPAARDTLIDTMSGLQSELQRLSLLIDNTGSTDDSAALPAKPTTNKSNNDGFPTTEMADYIHDLLKQETKRRNIGGGGVFGDPAWELLLDLMLAKIAGRKVSVSSACIASGAPMSTALRLVGRLVNDGVLHKIPDATDRRRHFLAIDADFEQPFLEYLAERAPSTGPSPDN